MSACGQAWVWVALLSLLPMTTLLYTPEDRLALLTGTLRTFQRHACDGTSLSLQCPVNTTIDITFARYGRPRQAEGDEKGVGHDPCPPTVPPSPHQQQLTTGCEYSHEINYKTLKLVIMKCQHKKKCQIDVVPHTFSDIDPCPDIRKYIEVAYKCRPETFISKITCVPGDLTLTCEKNSRLAIYSALFGRRLEGSYTCPQPRGVPEEDCQASYANEIVMKLCHGHRECHLGADPKMFGTPCSPDSLMYLTTAYTCVPKKILKTTSQEEDEEAEEGDEVQEEGSLMISAMQPPSSHPASPDPFYPASPQHTQSPTIFYNPTVTTKTSNKKSEKVNSPDKDYPRDSVAKPDLINCTVTILSGSRDHKIGFLTEWMRAIAFMKRNLEKLILYLMVGLCVGLLLFLIVVVGRLLLERHQAKKEAKMMHDPLTSVFATGTVFYIDDIDGDLDMQGALESSLGRSPSPQEPTQDVVRYNTARPGIRRQDSDTNPRSLSRNNNNQLFYS
ncbi:protein eva-1 isoform X1 [Cherax quadricarinatus]|uniref:protein eva-1 isoform X1 n=1 Tax=Cherax quadricarinatus TaxID=27406 RepID=UPI00387E524A